MINNELKRLKPLLLFAHADTRFTSAVTIEQSDVVPSYIGYSTTVVCSVCIYTTSGSC